MTITLHSVEHGRPIVLSPLHVVKFTPSGDGGSSVTDSNGITNYVRETVEEVKLLYSTAWDEAFQALFHLWVRKDC